MFKATRVSILTILLFTGFVHPAFAAKLRATCYQLDQAGQVIEGVNTDKKIEMGSVSKVVTAYWALAVKGPEARFQTKIYALPLSNHQWDLHFAGALDPDFGKLNLQLVVARLNQLGISKVRRLSFDSKFKYLDQPTSREAAHAFLQTTDPSSSTVMYHLKAAFTSINSGNSRFSDSAAKLNQIMGAPVPKSLSLKIGEFVVSDSLPFENGVTGLQSFVYQSVPLLALIKEMTRNSNNYFANLIFESLGGREAFAPFLKSALNLDERDLLMLNGSGDRFVENQNLGQYDQGTCEAILQILHALKNVLKNAGGLPLQSSMAVVGQDEGATVNVYENDWTKDAVVAKTGTVNPTVALAGLADTKNGSVFFASLFGPGNTVANASAARMQIRDILTQLIKAQGGPVHLDYKQVPFFPLDKNSDLQIEKSEAVVEVKQQ